jgi:hypothetical protein
VRLVRIVHGMLCDFDVPTITVGVSGCQLQHWRVSLVFVLQPAVQGVSRVAKMAWCHWLKRVYHHDQSGPLHRCFADSGSLGNKRFLYEHSLMVALWLVQRCTATPYQPYVNQSLPNVCVPNIEKQL